MTCPKCGQPSNKRYSSKESTYILNKDDDWSWWFDFGSAEYGFFTIDHIPSNYPSLEVGSCFKDKEEGHRRLAEMTGDGGWIFVKGEDKFSAAYGAEVGGQKSEVRGQDAECSIKYYALMICPQCNKQYDIYSAVVCEDGENEGLWICPDCEVPLDDVEGDDAERLAVQNTDAASAAPRLSISEMIKQGIISTAEGDMPSMPDAVAGTSRGVSLSIREKIKQAIMDMFEEGRPFMDVPDIAEEIARSVTEIIKDGATKEVVVYVRGGVAGPVSVPEGISVKIRDYDIDGCEDDDLSQDEGGEQCVERNYGAESMVYYVGDEDDGDPC